MLFPVPDPPDFKNLEGLHQRKRYKNPQPALHDSLQPFVPRSVFAIRINSVNLNPLPPAAANCPCQLPLPTATAH